MDERIKNRQNTHTHTHTHTHTQIIQTHTRILFAIKQKEILLFLTTWMDLDGITLNEMSDR